ncbi:MAG TPA: LLM class flavin-dependent oxidoreductase, partial [Jatrophihabitans sp.]|nr:LLM class flavin-dependent oxidoreductase [Jatrophihabitans sp.]
WLECLDVLLTREQVSFAGRFYEVPASTIAPLPVQKPRPPVLIGGSAPAALRRAGQHDGWISSSRASVEDVRGAVTAVRDAATRAGKAPDAVRCVVRGVTVLRETPVSDADRRALTGSMEQIREDLAGYAACGVDEVFLDLNFDSERVGDPAADPAVGMELAAQLLTLGAESF